MIASLPEPERHALLNDIPEDVAAAALYDWEGYWARPNQRIPEGDWRYWLLLAGRGFGKTRTGAETVRHWSVTYPRIHLVAPTAADARDVMVEGESGLLSCFPSNERPLFEPSKKRVTFQNGCVAYTFSADEPERLRGPQCYAFWADEVAAWRFGQEAWDQLTFGFRLGDNPRGVITTTPKPIKLVKDILSDPQTIVTRGSSYDNRVNIAQAFYDTIIKKYEGTRLGRQELLAEILDDLPGALWTRSMIEAGRVQDIPPLYRVVVAIDPAVTANEDSDETGIIAAGIGYNEHVYVLADGSLRASPNDWARAACRLLLRWDADRIVAEVNNGGDMVETTIRAVLASIPYRGVRASRGKAVRAEPVSALYEQRRVHHVGSFPDLEEQMCGYVPGISDDSPDRMDALVWAVYDLLLQTEDRAIVTYSPHVQISPV